MTVLAARLADIDMADVGRFGGKNASLGEMLRNLGDRGIRIPEGFATSGEAWREFLTVDGLDATIASLMHGVGAADADGLMQRTTEIRDAVLGTPLPANLQDAAWSLWHEICSGGQIGFAVRPSLTIEGSPEVSFAGLQRTLLNVVGFQELMAAIHEVYVSAYNDRTIAYCARQGIPHSRITVSVGVQRAN